MDTSQRRTEVVLATIARRHGRDRRQAAHRPNTNYRLLGLSSFMMIVLMMGLCVLASPLVAAAAIILPMRQELQAGVDRLNHYQLGSSFQTTHVYDRNHVLLAEFFGDGRRTLVPLSTIPRPVISATIATEDQTFRTNMGVDPNAVARALLQNQSAGSIVSGASTITQQVVRNTIFTYQERTDRSYQRKIKEALLAVVMTQTYSKDQILEIYLNEVYYGNLAYGIEAAAETYFHKKASDLNLAEAALLAGMPQSPVEYDPFTHLDTAKARQRVVLDLMTAQGYITPKQANAAYNTPLHFVPPTDQRLAPHFVDYVRSLLEQMYGPDKVANGGLEVTTTLDIRYQDMAQKIVADQIAKVRDNRNIHSGAVVVLKPTTGEVLAMVGSADYYDRSIDGQVNAAIRDRQPGSSIKPINYSAAMEDGLSPGQLIMDEKLSIPQDQGKAYSPINYDHAFHGLLTLRSGFANSYNIPAIRVIHYNGIQRFIDKAHAMGITGLNRGLEWYGPAITLGGGEVKLIDLATAYATIDNLGGYVPNQAILKVTDGFGNVLFDYHPPAPKPVLDPRAAFMTVSIMSDYQARWPAFGRNNPLELSDRIVAAKTGTTTDFKDNWTLGFTPGVVVGVWVGNPNGQPMVNSTGITGAAPIWHDVMAGIYANADLQESLKVNGQKPTDVFPQPPGVVKASICEPTPGGGCKPVVDWVFAEQAQALGSGPLKAQMGKVSVAQLPAPIQNGSTPINYCRLPGNRLQVPQEVRTFDLTVASVPSQQPGVSSLWDGNDRLLRIRKFLVGNEFSYTPPYKGAKPQAAYLTYPYNDSANVKTMPECTVALLTGSPSVSATAPSGPVTLQAVGSPTPEGTPGPTSVPGATDVPTPLPTPTLSPTPVPLPPTPAASLNQGGSGVITFPGPGQTVNGAVVIQGSANFSAPTFSYYKLELAPAGSSNFMTIGSVHNAPASGQLEVLNAGSLAPGDYTLRLMLVKPDGNYIIPSQVQFTVTR